MEDNYDEQTLESRLAFYMAEFDAKFPTLADCVEELYRRSSGGQAQQCSGCDSHLVNKKYGARSTRCQSCGTTTWHTAGTFFHGVRTIRAWLAAIWLTEQGLVLSSSRFHKLVGIAQSTALQLLHKLRSVIRQSLEPEEGHVPSARFSRLFTRRSLVTPARLHPCAEQIEFEPDELGPCQIGPDTTITDIRFSEASDFAIRYFGSSPEVSSYGNVRDDDKIAYAPQTPVAGDNTACRPQLNVERQLYDLLSNKPTSTEMLCQNTGIQPEKLAVSLLVLELAGLVQRLPGDCYVRCKPDHAAGSSQNSSADENLGEQIAGINSACSFIARHFHGISRKYLQNYLAAFRFHTRQDLVSPGNLMSFCTQSKRVRARDLREYVTPSMVFF